MGQKYNCYRDGARIGAVDAENPFDARKKAKKQFGEDVSCKLHD